MESLQSKDYHHYEVVEGLHVHVGLDLGFVLCRFELVVLLVSEGGVEVECADQNGRGHAEGTSETVSNCDAHQKGVEMLHFFCFRHDLPCVKKELKQSNPEV